METHLHFTTDISGPDISQSALCIILQTGAIYNKHVLFVKRYKIRLQFVIQ